MSPNNQVQVGGPAVAVKKRSLLPFNIIAVILFAGLMTALLSFSSAASSRTTIASGAWSNPAIWEGGVVPEANDKVVISATHDVILDTSAVISGAQVNGTLTYDPDKNVTLETNKNVVVEGQLVMVPSDADKKHMLEFFDVDESAFVGGGLDVLESDVGLWVMKNGQLYTNGLKKRGWTNATDTIPKGATQFEVDEAFGWQVGDLLSIAPSGQPDFGGDERRETYDGFHEATITAVNGNNITIDQPTWKEHPKVNGKWTAEVMNLSRNVSIGGANYDSKSHVFISSTKPQFIRYTELPYTGPGELFDDGYAVRNQALGRYSLHFHHSGNGSSGSIVEGVSAYRYGHRAFVPHESHGITLYDTVAYDGAGAGYWWDLGDESSDILIDRTMVARAAPTTFGGYFLGSGRNIEVRDSVATGLLLGKNQGGFYWENGADGSWEFDGNVAHNINGKGIRVWQNNSANHILTDTDIYYVTTNGIFHGAYGNDYHYKDTEIYVWGGDSAIHLAATSDYVGVKVEDAVIDGGDVSTTSGIVVSHSAVPTAEEIPMVIRNPIITGRGAQTLPAIAVWGDTNDKKVEVINPTFGPGASENIWLDSTAGGGERDVGDERTWVKVQEGNSAYILRPQDQNLDQGATFDEVANAWKKPIAKFDSGLFSDGDGFLAEYYDDLNLTELVYTGIEPYIQFEEEIDPFYHLLDDNNTAARYTGKLVPEYDGRYVFETDYSHYARLFIDGQPLINEWGSHRDGISREQFPLRAEIDMQAGREYDIVLELATLHQPNSFSTFAAEFNWKTPVSSSFVVVPEQQILLPDGYSARPFTTNDIAIAEDPALPPFVDGNPNPDPNPQPDPDVTPPTISLRSLGTDAVSGVINLEAEATDNDQIQDVTFIVDGEAIGTVGNQPYSILWDTAQYDNGPHEVRATTSDVSGNTSQTPILLVVVDNQSNDPNPDPNPDPDPQPDDQPPTKPTGLTLDAISFNAIAFSWSQSSDNIGVDSYEIYRNGTILARSQEVTYTDTAVAPGTTYTYSIRAVDAEGNVSEESEILQASTSESPDTSAPTAPGNLTAELNQTSVELSWGASEDNRGIQHYLVQRNGQTIEIVTSTSFTDNTIAPGQSYRYRVLAVDTTDNLSEPSNTVSVDVPSDEPDEPSGPQDTEPPTAPENMRIRRANNRKIVTRWKRSTDNVEVAYYKVFRDGELIATTTRRRFGDGQVQKNATYEYHVVAVDTSGNESGESDTAIGTATRNR